MMTISSNIEANDQFRNWNNQIIKESAKMIRLVLILLIIWTAFAIGWTIHLIIHNPSAEDYINKDNSLNYNYYYKNNPRMLYKRSDDKLVAFEDLSFYTEINSKDWEKIKTFVGSFHRLKESSGKVPTLNIIIDEELDELKRGESSVWNKVHFHFSKIGDDSSVWISSDYVFDSIELDMKRAELVSEADAFESSFQKGRKNIIYLIENSIELVDEETQKTVLKPPNAKIKKMAKAFGLTKKGKKNFSCHVDLKKEAIMNGAEILGKPIKSSMKNNSGIKKKLAIGVPTTSKGMKKFQDEHVILKALIPSLKATLTSEELQNYHITIFIGFDYGDDYFENGSQRLKLKEKMASILPEAVEVIFLRLQPIRRVAMTWNMIFAFAQKHDDYDYFYQVNDDLTMKTEGWLERFARTLDENRGFGVVGPSDSFNGFSCSLLTQAFVSKLHLRIFSGLFYPLSFKDWKSDRWLSFVYGDENTRCWPEIEATNGASSTRYTACPYPEWKIELKNGKKLIEPFQVNKINKN